MPTLKAPNHTHKGLVFFFSIKAHTLLIFVKTGDENICGVFLNKTE